jgi:hypothetical protein
MNNLTPTQQKAKAGLLDSQRRRVLDQYRNASQTEQLAVIKNIDSFLPTLKADDEKIFWLRLRENLERLSEQQAA